MEGARREGVDLTVGVAQYGRGAQRVRDPTAVVRHLDARASQAVRRQEAARKMWFDPLAECGIRMSMLVGNHDIVGGGTSGWMTAAAFCKTFPKWDITMVSSGDPINVGSDRLPR